MHFCVSCLRISILLTWASMGERGNQIEKWSPVFALQILRVSSDSEEVVYRVVRFPWKHPSIVSLWIECALMATWSTNHRESIESDRSFLFFSEHHPRLNYVRSMVRHFTMTSHVSFVVSMPPSRIITSRFSTSSCLFWSFRSLPEPNLSHRGLRIIRIWSASKFEGVTI